MAAHNRPVAMAMFPNLIVLLTELLVIDLSGCNHDPERAVTGHVLPPCVPTDLLPSTSPKACIKTVHGVLTQGFPAKRFWAAVTSSSETVRATTVTPDRWPPT